MSGYILMAPSSITSRTTSSSLKLLVVYWAVGIAVGVLALRMELTQLVSGFSPGHVVSLGIGLLATLVTMVAYDRVSLRGVRSLHIPTLIAFPLLNGLCETILFIASFKLGTILAAGFTTQPLWLFVAGTTTFFAYSGAIHALFWLKILPPHLNKSPAVKRTRIVWIIGLVTLSLMWGWLYFAYQDIWSIVALHVLFDAGMVYSIRYRLT